MATEAKRVNIIDIFIIEEYECCCLTTQRPFICGMLTFMSLTLLTMKPNNTIDKKRLKEVRGMGRV